MAVIGPFREWRQEGNSLSDSIPPPTNDPPSTDPLPKKDDAPAADHPSSAKNDETKTTPDDIQTLASLIRDILGQSISIPAAGQAQIVPRQTATTSAIPVLLIVAGIGGVGYMIYKNRKKPSGEHA